MTLCLRLVTLLIGPHNHQDQVTYEAVAVACIIADTTTNCMNSVNSASSLLSLPTIICH